MYPPSANHRRNNPKMSTTDTKIGAGASGVAATPQNEGQNCLLLACRELSRTETDDEGFVHGLKYKPGLFLLYLALEKLRLGDEVIGRTLQTFGDTLGKDCTLDEIMTSFSAIMEGGGMMEESKQGQVSPAQEKVEVEDRVGDKLDVAVSEPNELKDCTEMDAEGKPTDDQTDPGHGQNRPEPEPEPMDLPGDLKLDGDKTGEKQETAPLDLDTDDKEDIQDDEGEVMQEVARVVEEMVIKIVDKEEKDDKAKEAEMSPQQLLPSRLSCLKNRRMESSGGSSMKMGKVKVKVLDNRAPVGIKVDKVTINVTPAGPMVPVIPVTHQTGPEIYNFVNAEKMYIFRVLHVNTPFDFYMEYVRERLPSVFSEVSTPDAGSKFLKPQFWTDLQVFYRFPELREAYTVKTELLRKRMYVVGLTEAGEKGCPPIWKRCVLLDRQMSTRRANVLLIDEARDVWVKMDQLYEMAPIFADPPSAGFRCYLADINSLEDPNCTRPGCTSVGWNPIACKEFENLVLGKRVSAYVTTKSIATFPNTTYPQCRLGVTLYVLDDKPGPGLPLTTENVNIQMVKKRLAVSTPAWLEMQKCRIGFGPRK